MFGRKLALDDDLYEKMRKCSESEGYSSPEEFALHVLEKEVERILGGEEASQKRLQGLGYVD